MKEKSSPLSDDTLLELFHESEQDDGNQITLVNKQHEEERYCNKKLLATGGMKEIYQAHDNKTGKELAYAQLRPDFPLEAQEALLLEAKRNALLDHPNIITVSDIGFDSNGKAYFTMDLKIGDSFEEILQQVKNKNSDYLAKFPLNKRLDIFLKICDAISYAHSRQILHLDIKPANIQVGQFGEVLVCDWGLGKLINDEVSQDTPLIELSSDFLNEITLSGEIKGTPGYMAPEQIEAKEKTKACDIYALGALLYKCLSLEDSVTGSSEEKISKSLKSQLETFPKRANIPKSLKATCFKALAKTPSQRYLSVEALQNEIIAYLNGFPSQAENATSLDELKYFLKRHKTLSVSILSFLITLTSLIYLFILQLQEQVQIEKKSKQDLSHALRLYEKEKSTHIHSLKQSADEITPYIYKLSDYDVYEDPVYALDFAIKSLEQLITTQNTHTPKLLLNQKNFIHFMRQEFKICAQSPYNFKNLGKLSQEIATFEKNGTLLSPDSFQKMIQLLKNNNYRNTPSLIAQMLPYDAKKRGDIVAHSKLVKWVIKEHNPTWKENSFHFEKKNKSLKLTGSIKNLHVGYYNVRIRKHVSYCFLNSLNINSLDLSHSDFDDLKQIKNLSLTKLNIAETKILDLHPIQQILTLQTLTISHGQFTEKKLKRIPSHIQIIFHKPKP